jgi:TPR repeat protein
VAGSQPWVVPSALAVTLLAAGGWLASSRPCASTAGSLAPPAALAQANEPLHRLEAAAAAGSPHALFLLGNAYRAGAGVERDPARALALYRQAGERGDATALQTLALALRYGELGLAPDEDAARALTMEAEHAAREPIEMK